MGSDISGYMPIGILCSDQYPNSGTKGFRIADITTYTICTIMIVSLLSQGIYQQYID